MISGRRIRDGAQSGPRRGCGSGVQMMVMVVMMRRVMVVNGSGRCGRRRRANFIPQYSRDAGNRGHVVLVAHAVGQQSVPDFPCEYPRVLELQLLYVLHDFGGGDAGFAAPDGPGQNAPRFVVPGEDFTDAAVAHAELSRNVAGPDAQLGQFHYSESYGVWQWSAVHEDAA